MPPTPPPPSPPTQTKTLTIRQPPYTYLHLHLLSSTLSTDAIDILTFRTYLTSALQQYLGLTGTAIPIDILKTEERECWIRVPAEDGSRVVGALGMWVGGAEGGMGWRVRGRGEWLGVVVAGGGKGLFEA